MLEPEATESADRVGGALRRALEPAPSSVRRVVSRALAPPRVRRAYALNRWAAVCAAGLALGLGLFVAGRSTSNSAAGLVPRIANQGSIIVIRGVEGSGFLLSSGTADCRNSPLPGSLLLITHGGLR